MLKLLPAFALLPLAALASTPDAVPLERYTSLIQRSPFSLASAPAPTEAPSFAKDYYIAGMATLGDKTFVTISSRDNQTRFSLLEGESFEDITLSRVEWVHGVGKSRAVLTKDGTSGTVSFDEVAMRAAPAPAAPVVAQPQNNQGQQGAWGNWGGDNRWEGRRGRGGRDRQNWTPEQRQYMREQRRAMFRAMHGQGQGQHGGAPQQQGQGNQFQRQQPIHGQ